MILNFGSCNIDYVYTLDHIVAVGETEGSVRREVFPGGKGLNQTIAAARAGAKVYHAGCVGGDGDLLLETLREGGADLTFMRKVDAPSGHAIIQVNSAGENAIFILTGANGMFEKDYIDGVLDHFSAGDILLLQNEINNIGYIVGRAAAKGMAVIFNPSPISDAVFTVDFDAITILMLNEIEGSYLTGQDEPEKIVSALRQKYKKLKIVLTLGEKGCMYHDGKALFYHAAYDVPVVDTTAAGDTFTGYFTAALAEGLTAEKALERACAASALTVSRMGASPSVPRLDEVLAALPSLREKRTEGEAEPLRAAMSDYLTQNLQDASLSGLAGKLGYTPVYAGQLFKRATGKCFSEALQEARCSEAAKLLRATDLPVSAIIHKIGYNNEGFFRRKFMELYGMLPNAYRRALREKSK